MPKLDVNLDRAGHGIVKLDGREIEHVRSITLHLEAGEISQADIELVGVDVDVRLEDAEVTVERVTYHPERQPA